MDRNRWKKNAGYPAAELVCEEDQSSLTLMKRNYDDVALLAAVVEGRRTAVEAAHG